MNFCSSPLPRALQEVVGSEFGRESREQQLLARFLDLTRYDSDFAQGLIEIARGKNSNARQPWDLRCAAILMLESQWLKLRPANHVDLCDLALCLGIDPLHNTLN